MKTVTVYHGTSSHYWDKIEKEGLVPQRHRKHVYVTTDYERAKEYAFIWTGGLLHEEQELIKNGDDFTFAFMETEGVIFTLELPESMLEIDDYNLKGEPNQYKIKGAIDPRYITESEEVYFENLIGDEVTEEQFFSEILRARALLVGVSQWGED